jgi:hypothetical protein
MALASNRYEEENSCEPKPVPDARSPVMIGGAARVGGRTLDRFFSA